MKKSILTMVAVCAIAAGANGATLLSWDLTGVNSGPTTVASTGTAANLDSGGSFNTLIRGAGAASNGAVNNSFRTTGFQNNGIATTNTDYFQFTLSAASGFTLSISTIDGKFGGTTTYSTAGTPSQVQFAYSLDGTSFTLIGSAASFTSNALANAGSSWDTSGISALQNIGASTTVFFRMYATGATSTGGYGLYSASAGTIALDAIGTLTAVPEPATVAMVGMGMGLALWGFRRRRSVAGK